MKTISKHFKKCNKSNLLLFWELIQRYSNINNQVKEKSNGSQAVREYVGEYDRSLPIRLDGNAKNGFKVINFKLKHGSTVD